MCLMSNIIHLIWQVEYLKLHWFQAEQKKKSRSGGESDVYAILMENFTFKKSWANDTVTIFSRKI